MEYNIFYNIWTIEKTGQFTIMHWVVQVSNNKWKKYVWTYDKTIVIRVCNEYLYYIIYFYEILFKHIKEAMQKK